jgi:hypothetical protein
MELARMDDVAGCRLIFPNIAELYSFRARLHAAKFKHHLRNAQDKWDYIAKPKETGYRGIHDVYEYDANSDHGKPFKGLLIELQYRTQAQHAWATCVEVVGFVTASQPKFQEGDVRYERVLALASEMIARSVEDSKASIPDLSDEELVKSFLQLDEELSFMRLLRGLNAANNDIKGSKNVILIMAGGTALETRTFRDATDAIRALFTLEKENPGKDIVLVRADTSDEVRVAFRNYFTDATEFIQIIDRACQKLGGVRTLTAPRIIAHRARRAGKVSGIKRY